MEQNVSPMPSKSLKSKLKAFKVNKTFKMRLLQSSSVPTTSRIAQPIKSTAKRVFTASHTNLLVKPKCSTVGKLTSEELEMKKINEEKAKQLESMNNNKMKYQGLKRKTTADIVVSKSTKALTIPKTPIKSLSSRLGKKICSITHTAEPIIVSTVHNQSLGPTLFEPFNLQTEKRAKVKGNNLPEKTPIKPNAELEQEFMRDSRTHFVPVNAAKHLTEPKTPKFHQIRRSSTIEVKSREEMEQEEMEMLQKRTFKAKPVDRRIFDGAGDLGVPKIQAKSCTEQVPFNLRTERRVSVIRNANSTLPVETSFVFKALPLPDYNQMNGSPRLVQSFKPTVPVSPKLRGGVRAASAPARRQKLHHTIVKKQRAKEAELYRSTFESFDTSHLKLTEPKAFELRTSVRGNAKSVLLNEKLRQEQEKENYSRNIHAKPPPKLAVFRPISSKKALTEIHEFSLKSTSRHANAQENFNKNVQNELNKENSKKVFKARSIPKTLYETVESDSGLFKETL